MARHLKGFLRGTLDKLKVDKIGIYEHFRVCG